MSSKRIKELFDTIGASNQEIARCAGCTPSTISRLRSGARNPAPHSPTVDKLIEGTIHYATLHDHIPELLELADVNDEELLDSGLRKWLFAEGDNRTADTPSELGTTAATSRPSFSEKLDSVMQLSDMSNIKLARLVNIDTSYVSRFRNGIRSPKSNPELLDRICQALYEHVASKEMFLELARLINIPVSSLYDKNHKIKADELYMHFHAWMDDFSSSDHDAIKHLLGTIDTFTPNLDITIPPLSQLVSDDILNDTSSVYKGISGLQQAVLRFLGCAIRDKYEELYLYSDQGMEWLTDNDAFRARWVALMALCIKQGTHIKIIHNIDRDITEMISAVESWFPLYVTGMIESYYNKKSCGTRFKHTIFLCPGKACIASCHTNDNDDRSIYSYYTEPMFIDFLEDNFQCLMNDAGSLVNIVQNAVIEADNNLVAQDAYNNLSLSISQNKVIIVKNSVPRMIITFTHPLLCNAFQAYIEHTQ